MKKKSEQNCCNGLSDNDYAARIYCKVFNEEETNGDVHVRGVLDAIKMLTEREQHALECYYRNGMTYKQTGAEIGGVTGTRAKEIIGKSLRKLRHTTRSLNMSVSKILGKSNEIQERMNAVIKEKDGIIKGLYDQIEGILHDKQINQELQDMLERRKPTIEELELSIRLYNVLKRAGFNKVGDILVLDNFDELEKIRGFGKNSQTELITMMREQGYIDWADKMEVPHPKTEFEEMNFCTYTRKRLINAGVCTLKDLLALDDYDALSKIYGLGENSLLEIITKMRESGHTKWADKMVCRYKQ